MDPQKKINEISVTTNKAKAAAFQKRKIYLQCIYEENMEML